MAGRCASAEAGSISAAATFSPGTIDGRTFTVDPDGDVFATSTSITSFQASKYDGATFGPLWTSPPLGAGPGLGAGPHFSVVPGGIVVAGYTFPNSDVNTVWYVAKLNDSDASVAWVQQFSNGGVLHPENKVHSLITAADGTVFVGGSLMAADGTRDMVVKRLNGANGQAEWSYSRRGILPVIDPGLANSTSRATVLTLTDDGDVIVGGTLSGQFATPTCQGYGMIIARFDGTDGTLQWEQLFEGKCHPDSTANKIVLGGDSAFVCATLHDWEHPDLGGGTLYPSILRLAIADGALLWRHDGCESDCTYSPVVQVVGAGDTVTTDPNGAGATEQVPLRTALTTPNAGEISISMATASEEPEGWNVVSTEISIEAPPASASSPLRLVLTVDVSAIPPGVDASRLDVTRNGVLIGDCTGPAGSASPDPCIESRSLLMDGDVQISVLTSAASRWSVVVRGLFDRERKCVNGMNGAGVKVAKAQCTASLKCLSKAAKGDEPDAQACLSADIAGKIAGAKGKVSKLASSACATAPPFAFTGADAVNSSAQDEIIALVADVLGDDLTASVLPAEDTRASCQNKTLKALFKLFQTQATLFLKCKKAGLSGKSSLMTTALDLQHCLDLLNADERGKVAKAAGKLAATVVPCSDSEDTVYPGICFGDAECLRDRVDCRVCRMFNAMDGIGADCDLHDDGAANGSCD